MAGLDVVVSWWFSDFMGGIRFKNYIAKRVSGTVVVEDTAHPAMKGLPSTFVVGEEEWYTFDKDPRPNVHVLAHVDEASYQPPSDIKMGDHPVIWTDDAFSVIFYKSKLASMSAPRQGLRLNYDTESIS